MKTAKRLGAFLLTLALMLALAGCGAKEATAPEQGAPVLDIVQSDASALPEGTPETSVPPVSSVEEDPTGSALSSGNEDIGKKQEDLVEEIAQTCTVSISCAAILEHMDELDPEKAELVPADGVLLPATELTVAEGESVFDLLLRVCRENRIHMEFSSSPVYGSAYIEGIGNLYEFDCGDGSGWMYRVNGEFPNYGCSQYALCAGDTVEWVYTCDFGADVGGEAGA